MNWKTELILIGGVLVGAYYFVTNIIPNALKGAGAAIGGTINAITENLPDITPTQNLSTSASGGTGTGVNNMLPVNQFSGGFANGTFLTNPATDILEGIFPGVSGVGYAGSPINSLPGVGYAGAILPSVQGVNAGANQTYIVSPFNPSVWNSNIGVQSYTSDNSVPADIMTGMSIREDLPIGVTNQATTQIVDSVYRGSDIADYYSRPGFIPENEWGNVKAEFTQAIMSGQSPYIWAYQHGFLPYGSVPEFR